MLFSAAHCSRSVHVTSIKVGNLVLVFNKSKQKMRVLKLIPRSKRMIQSTLVLTGEGGREGGSKTNVLNLKKNIFSAFNKS